MTDGIPSVKFPSGHTSLGRLVVRRTLATNSDGTVTRPARSLANSSIPAFEPRADCIGDSGCYLQGEVEA
jgi:hypothetical protein